MRYENIDRPVYGVMSALPIVSQISGSFLKSMDQGLEWSNDILKSCTLLYTMMHSDFMLCFIFLFILQSVFLGHCLFKQE